MSWNHKVMAAVLAAGSDALASHLTGAALYWLDEIARTRIIVTVGGTTALRLRGVVVHRSLVLAPQDRASIDGIPVMSVACTIVHCTGLLSMGQLARVMDDALVRRLVTIDEIAETAERLGPAPGRRMKTLRLLIAERGRRPIPQTAGPKCVCSGCCVRVASPSRSGNTRFAADRRSISSTRPTRTFAWPWSITVSMRTGHGPPSTAMQNEREISRPSDGGSSPSRRRTPTPTSCSRCERLAFEPPHRCPRRQTLG